MQKLTDQDPETQSADLIAGNIALLQSLLPEAFTEGKVDFEVLKQLLGGAIDDREEKYGLNWHGKRRARQIALTPSTGTLRPCPEESVDWDTTQNLMIEGDNLEVLKLLQKSYAGKVKLIYIDPPYNTGNDFVYPDDFRDNIQNYLELTGQVESGKKISTNTETNGRFHTDWLNMIYPRLYLARNLLANTGLILIHIDEHESENLRLVLNEIFGVENDLGEIIWDKKNPKGDSTKIASQHEKVLAYAKNLSALKESSLIKRPKANAEKMIAKAAQLIRKVGSISIPSDLEEVSRKYDLDFNVKAFAQAYTLDDARREYREWLAKQDVSGGEAAYKYIDDDGEIFRTVSMAWPNKKTAPDEYFEPLIHPVTKKICPVPDRGWRNPPATMAELIKADLIVFGEDETKQPERKYLLKENMEENIPSVLPFGGSDDALLTRLGIPFDNPKPLEFVKSVITYFVGNEGIILDFFAGSATVGHACLELKAEGKSIDFVLVQLPEKLSITKPEQKIGVQFCKKLNVPENIAEIAKERLRRVTVKFTNQTNKKIGFRVFKLDSSNINAWEPNRDDLAGTLHQYAEHLKTDRTEQDILFELLLKLGLNLTVPIEQKTISGKTVHSIGAGTLLTCLAPQISNDEAESLALGIVDWHKQLSPAGETQVVFRDSAFADDVGKTNLTAILQQNGLENVRSL